MVDFAKHLKENEPPPEPAALAASIIWRAKHGAESIEDLAAEFFEVLGPANGYDVRPGQVAMARMAGRSGDLGGLALAEAPTGTGKGLAYLVPGLLHTLRLREAYEETEDAPKPPILIVSTAGISLQSQLVNKDIPGLAKALGIEIPTMLVKGRNNYLCASKVEAERAMAGRHDQDRDEINNLISWGDQDGCTGDREDLPFAPSKGAWGRLSVMAEQCTGRSCRLSGVCFVEKARRTKSDPLILVCNHHWLAIHPRPPAGAFLAIDEGHELEDAIRGTQSSDIAPGTAAGIEARTMRYLPMDADATLPSAAAKEVDALYCEAAENFQRTRDHGATEVAFLEGWRGDRAKDRFPNLRELRLVFRRYTESEECPSGSDDEKEDRQRMVNLVRSLWRTELLCRSLSQVEPVKGMPGNREAPWAFWGEEKGGKIYLKASPADTAQRLAALRSLYPDGILCSATLATGGNFNALRMSFGMGHPGMAQFELKSGEVVGAGPREEAILPSPYPLKDMGITIVPDGPGPKDRDWPEWAVARAVEAVEWSRGRALILSSTNRQMRAYAEAIRENTDFVVRCQGEEGRARLLEWFKVTPNAVLVGTRSFYTGIDIVGAQLSLVLIDRAPFTPPGIPIEDAVEKLLVARNGGGSGFWLRSLPNTCRVVTQGTGRLIRDPDDRGALVVLDRRILGGTTMGRALMASIPPFPVSSNMADIRRILP